jgi:hypothetical protein
MRGDPNHPRGQPVSGQLIAVDHLHLKKLLDWRTSPVSA